MFWIADGEAPHETVQRLKQESMEHMNAALQRSTAAATTSQSKEPEQDVDMMEEPADFEVEDDEVQKLATQLGEGSSGKRKRSGKKGNKAAG